MGEPVPVGRACSLCGEQISLHVRSDHGTYTDDLTALLSAHQDARLLVEAECGCPTARTVTLEGTSWRPGE